MKDSGDFLESKDFGEYMRALRKRKGLTISQLEKLTGISNAYISQIETGKRRTPSPDILQKLAQHLDVSYEHIMLEVGYMQRDIEHHAPFDLMQILQHNDVFFNGIKLSAKQCQLLRDIVEEFTKTSADN